MKIGIDDIGLSVPQHFFALEELAERHGIDPQKYLVGIGQEFMAVPAPDEDIVTLAANATLPLLDDATRASIATVILATESGIDQSKAAGLFVHSLLGLRADCRVVEFKQACYGATAGLQMARALVAQRPHEKVLVIATDIARYEQNSEGECTQGAGAVAMIVAENPRLLELHPHQGRYSLDVSDFWRPNLRSTALVDGKLSIEVYLESLRNAWQSYRADGGLGLEDMSFLCFHQPFTKMAKKAFSVFEAIEPEAAKALGEKAYSTSQLYGKAIGNCYTASLYIALLSLLDNSDEDLTGRNIGLFSYGSGSVGEFFSATVVPGYQAHSRRKAHARMLASRTRLGHEQYSSWFYGDNHPAVADYSTPYVTGGAFRYGGCEGYRRQYESTALSLKMAS
ncbi:MULTISPECIES: hydroxymethylglutaryl-CoA synthase [unclassified Pseudomonas]|uniref:hydroxymethylglutaryl-CoA synthase n=1 Tax=unclassified Pseudomonas TaxID=196821 RepID=UPI001E5B7BAC|nr:MULTISPECIES: hydroxymethylglutaryl-CoA synthase [unclassified Pseudomonas]MCE0916421.1 hydroxymethylglutaryl-CoA synthase [Pseudomonas sp. NMI760_13]MCP8632279.1 hydroxymethylglutaryl-CoA synthase [Pseudomonas sp. DVZ6]MDC0690959.1 hydroxymethylglutaryl-CoA synthase [Mitsuaria sp. RG]MDD7782564.1 hydroxymethylglutaryl-CoA synthase [Pseudomonas sp. DVZ24]